MHSAERPFITGGRLLRACGTGPGRADALPRPRAPGMRHPRRAQARRPGARGRCIPRSDGSSRAGVSCALAGRVRGALTHCRARGRRACGTRGERKRGGPERAGGAFRGATVHHGQASLARLRGGSGRADASPRSPARGMRRPRRAQARRPGARGRCIRRSGRSSRAGVSCVLAGRVGGALTHRRVRGRGACGARGERERGGPERAGDAFGGATVHHGQASLARLRDGFGAH